MVHGKTALLVVAVVGCASPPPPRPQVRTSDPCETNAAIAGLLAPTPAGYIEIDAVAERARKLRVCPRLAANLRRFVAAVSQQARRRFRFGFSISDRAYVQRSRVATALPPLLGSQRLLQLMKHPDGYAKALRLIQHANTRRAQREHWSAVFYQSRFLRSADQRTYGRLLVVVPGAPIRWIQYGITTPGMNPATPMNSISVVAIDHSEAFWMDNWRIYRDDRIEVAPRVMAGHGNVNCYNCHKTPVVPIHPNVEYTLNKRGALVVARTGAGPLVRRLNRAIRGYGPASFGGLLDPQSYGPPLGDPDRPRSAAFWTRCTRRYSLDAAALVRVKRALACAKCHDGSYLSPINFPQALHTDQDHDVLRHPDSGRSMALVPTYVRAGWMPPQSALRPVEREALINCLMMDYYDSTARTGALVDWLRGG